MKLTHVRVKDFRSFSGQHEFAISPGGNFVVGPNNCGKSNLIRALELALVPDAIFSPEQDRPAQGATNGAPRITRITLTFSVGRTGPENTLITRAREYERAALGSDDDPTFADDREVRIVTTFPASGVRQTSFGIRGAGARSLAVDSLEHQRLEAQFRSVVRFAVVHSGEDLTSLLTGKFREILQMVISDHLGDEMNRVRVARENYLTSLQTELLEPLRSQILERVAEMFPEITTALLVPDVPTLDDTLSSVDVRLGDTLTTQLSEKGTGVRGSVLVSMLQYLADQSRRSLVLAVEEPEAFLHPSAQEAIRDELDRLAKRASVTLIVTSHSPYVISRKEDASVTALRKAGDGTTSIAGTSTGVASRAGLLSPLYRDSGFADVVERTLSIPDDAELIVATEGYTDGQFIRLVCEHLGKSDLLQGIHFIHAGGASKVVLQALTLRGATSVPVIAMLDRDAHGNAARDSLKKFEWSTSADIVMLSDWPGTCRSGHDVEVEDLLPASAVDVIRLELGDELALDATQRCGNALHRSYSTLWKERALERLPAVLRGPDEGGIIWLVETLASRRDKIKARQLRARRASDPSLTSSE